MNKMIEAAYGFNYVEQILKVWLGEKPNIEKKYAQYAFTQYVTVSERGVLQKVTGKKRASVYEGVYDVYVRPRKGVYLHPPYSMGHRYAYVLAASPVLKEARLTAKAAAKEIKFHLA